MSARLTLNSCTNDVIDCVMPVVPFGPDRMRQIPLCLCVCVGVVM